MNCGSSKPRKVSFILPVTLSETASRPWRGPVNENVLLRTEFLLRSFVMRFDQDDLANFFFVSPARDLARLSPILRSITRDSRYELVAEGDIYPDLGVPAAKPMDGWRAQQMLKLAIAKYVCTSHYVTLDHDVACIRDFSFDDLVVDGRSVTNCETLADYEQLYTSAFANEEFAIKQRRYVGSAEILGRVIQGARDRFYGETPTVLHTESVSRLLDHLSGRFGRKWSDMLARWGGWTEYGLYYNFLEMTGQLDTYCKVTNSNCVLDLQRSIWQASKNYRNPRLYDLNHFSQGFTHGIFIAIQSWLPASYWLPVRYDTVVAFYNDLACWLGMQKFL